MKYDDNIELLFKNSAEQIQAMAILNQMSHNRFLKLSSLITIPIIALSSAVGFLSQIETFEHANILLGLISLSVSFLKSIESYYDLTKRCETYRILYLQYNKIFNFINIQLNLSRNDRIACADLLSLLINDLNELEKVQPIISNDIIKEFNKKYGENYEPNTRPPILNGLTNINIHKVETVNIDIQTDKIEQEQANQKRPWK